MTTYYFSWDQLSINKVVNLFLYGSTTTPRYYEERLRSTPEYNDTVIVQVAMEGFMTSGPGRYAKAANAKFVQDFFNETVELDDGSYTRDQLVSEYGVSIQDFRFSLEQYKIDPSSQDYAQRLMVYNSAGYTISPDTIFVVDNGNRYVQDMAVRVFDDNFDFQSDSELTQFGNDYVLKELIDPYEIGKKVEIEYRIQTSEPVISNYDYSTFQSELSFIDGLDTNNWGDSSDLLSLLSAVGQISYGLFSSGTVQYYTPWGGEIKYGTNGGDIISGTVSNDILIGGEGNDSLSGGLFDDKLFGGEGNDELTGGWGADSFYFLKSHGHDSITDFQTGTDTLYISGYGPTWREVDGSDLIIHTGPNSSVRLIDVGDEPVQVLPVARGGAVGRPFGFDGDGNPIPEISENEGYLGDANGGLGNAETKYSPLVLDLTGSGIALTELGSTGNVYWKADPASPFAQRSAWIAEGTGLLALDLNANGYIDDNTELFGTLTDHGFGILAAYDSNGDNAISGEDQIWTSLRIWTDTNQNGFSEASELNTLDSLLITSISLSYTEVNYAIAGNDITHESTFVINGNTRTIVDAWFSHDVANTMYVDDYAFNPDVWFLPNLRGYGELADLGIAMSLDGDQEDEDSLISLVTALADKPIEELFDGTSALVDDVRAILFRWAEADGLASDSRGNFVDARELVFLEKLTGQAFKQNNWYSNPTGPNAGGVLFATFEQVFNELFANLLIQTAASQIFAEAPHFDPLTGTVTNADVLDLDVLDALEDFATGLSTTGERSQFWSDIVRMIEYTVGTDNLDIDSRYALETAIVNSDVALNLDDVVDGLTAPEAVTLVNGSGGVDDTLTGTSGADSISGFGGHDTLDGGAGHDTLFGGDGNDVLIGGTGADFVQGEAGDDVYVYNPGDGWDAYYDTGGADKILFGAGIAANDLTFARASNNDLLISIDTGTHVGSILVQDHFMGSGYGIETIEFSDTTTLDVTAINNWVLTGSGNADILHGVQHNGGSTDTIYGGAGHDKIFGYAGDDVLHGEAGDDTIYGGDGADVIYGGDGNDRLFGDDGDDTLFGGNGNDTLYGGLGADTLSGGLGDDRLEGGYNDDEYHYDGGRDVILDNGGTSGDTLYLASGFTSGNVSYIKSGYDLIVYFDANDNITIKDFYNSTSYRVETLYFDGGPTVDLTAVTASTQGDSGNNSLTGSWGNDVMFGYDGDDTLIGSYGDDTLYGGAGNDTLDGGDGHDTLHGGTGNDSMIGSYGNDTYYYTSGSDSLFEISGTDVLILPSGYTANDLTFTRDASGDTAGRHLYIHLGGANVIKIGQHLYGTSYQVETIQFADTSTLSLTSLQPTAYGTSGNDVIAGINLDGFRDDLIHALDGNDTVTGSTGNDTVYGGNGNDTLDGGDGDDILYGEDGNDTLKASSGNDILYGGDGDDFLQGWSGTNTLDGGAGNDTLYGASGNDTYIYSSGMDLLREEYGSFSSVDRLIITSDVTINDITTSRSGYHANIVIDSGVDEIYLYNHHYNSAFNIDIIEFADGFVASLSAHESWTWGTSGDDTITGASGADTIIGKDGNDTLNGGNGADNIHGGSGDDVIRGGDGSDLLHGGLGDDILYGDDGADTIFGGAGADTFRFEAATAYSGIDIIKDFSLAQNDVIDIADVLDGIYDPMSDALTDFVQFSQSGSDTVVNIDRDGTGSTYGWTQVALLQGVVHTDPEALVTSGHLLAA